jgi:peroxiredoxin
MCFSQRNGRQAGRRRLKDMTSSPGSLAEALILAEGRNASLKSRLSEYRSESSRLRPDIAKVYDQLVERLNALDRGEVGPRLVTLSSLLRSGPAVISINRGHWCPYCKLELRSLAAINGEIERLGACTVSIMPDTARFTSSYAAENKLPFPVLSDIDLGYSLSLGLVFWVGPEIRRLYVEVGVELEKYQGNQGYFLPMAAKFIVGRDGLVKARQVNIEFRERMEPAAIIAALRAL